MRIRLCAAIFAILGTSCAADGLEFVDYAWLKDRTNQVIDFEGALDSGRVQVIDEVFHHPGASLGERFEGQTLVRGAPGSPLADFDIVTGQPLGPLNVIQGAAGQNLSLAWTVERGTYLYPESWVGFPAQASGGEGAVSILFEEDQPGFGFLVSASAGPVEYAFGAVEITCFDVSGATVGSLYFDELTWGRWIEVAVIRTDGAQDIRGCTLQNTDPKGVSYDSFIFGTDALNMS